MYKYHINDLPVRGFQQLLYDIHYYSTRQVNNFDSDLSVNKKSFSDHATRASEPHLWNSLPSILKELKTVRHFRNQLKQILIKTYERPFSLFEPVFVFVLCC